MTQSNCIQNTIPKNQLKASIYLKVNDLLIYLPKKLKKGSDKFIID